MLKSIDPLLNPMLLYALRAMGSPVQEEVQTEIDRAKGHAWPLASIDRMDFHERAKRSYCVVQTGERRFCGGLQGHGSAT